MRGSITRQIVAAGILLSFLGLVLAPAAGGSFPGNSATGKEETVGRSEESELREKWEKLVSREVGGQVGGGGGPSRQVVQWVQWQVHCSVPAKSQLMSCCCSRVAA